MSTETTVQNLKINKLTKAQYDTITPSATEAYELTDLSSILDTIPDTAQLSYYGTCATAAATRNKVVVCEGFALKTGISIRVKFTYAQTYNGSCRLNVNDTGNITVYSKSGTASVRYCWLEGEVVSFTYDGTYWIMDDAGIASTTYYGVTKLSTSMTSTSTVLAATTSAINSAMGNIVTGYPVYSATSAYTVGDKVRYSTNMYECNTEIAEGGEAWDATHWTQLPALTTQIDGKQDVLAAGNNITISGNTISATNTEYTNGTGLNLSNTTFSVDFTQVATAAQGGLADSAIQPNDNVSDLTNDAGYITSSALSGYQTTSNLVTTVTASSTDAQYPSAKLLYDSLSGKQATLVSGTNIKTVNNESLLGSGNVTIPAGSTITFRGWN